MIIGLNLGHDLSVELFDEEGRDVFASGEERFNRFKNSAGCPTVALAELLNQGPKPLRRLSANLEDSTPNYSKN